MRKLTITPLSLFIVALWQQQIVAAAEPQHSLPALYGDLKQCRQVQDRDDRLSCFEAATDAIDRAVAANELFIVDNAQLEVAKAASFGLSNPGPGLLLQEKSIEAGGKPDDELAGIVRSARSTPEGWVVTLEDGSVWRQVDTTTSSIDPQPGRQVTIKRAALGSYRLVFNRNVGFKVRREK